MSRIDQLIEASSAIHAQNLDVSKQNYEQANETVKYNMQKQAEATKMKTITIAAVIIAVVILFIITKKRKK